VKAVFSRIYYADTHIDIKILKQAIVIDVQAGIIVLPVRLAKSAPSGNIWPDTFGMWRARRNTRASRIMCKMVRLLPLALQFACSSSVMDFMLIRELLPLDTVL